MQEVHFFVCRNGFGHQKRVLSVSNALILIKPSIKIHIHCHHSTFERTKNWTISEELLKNDSIVFEFQCMEEAPDYLNGVTLNSINEWLKKVRTITKDYKGLFVIDNDASLLQIFNNAMLMGSFLWSDVITDSEKIDDFIQFEKTLIQNYQPKMMGVDDMAMPFVKNNQNFVGFPWFCNSHPLKDKNFNERNKILVTGGGTNLNQNRLINIAKQLTNNGEDVFVDQQLFHFSNHEFSLFGFKEIDFLNVKAVFCRPGMGILNDCIAYGIPIFAIEDENAELIHNGITIQELKLGYLVAKNINLETINELLNKNTLLDFHQAICNQKTEGATLVAKYINNQLLNERQ